MWDLCHFNMHNFKGVSAVVINIGMFLYIGAELLSLSDLCWINHISRFIHGVAVNLASMVSHTRQNKKLYTDFKTEKTVDKGRKLGRGGEEESLSI